MVPKRLRLLWKRARKKNKKTEPQRRNQGSSPGSGGPGSGSRSRSGRGVDEDLCRKSSRMEPAYSGPHSVYQDPGGELQRCKALVRWRGRSSQHKLPHLLALMKKDARSCHRTGRMKPAGSIPQVQYLQVCIHPIPIRAKLGRTATFTPVGRKKASRWKCDTQTHRTWLGFVRALTTMIVLSSW